MIIRMAGDIRTDSEQVHPRAFEVTALVEVTFSWYFPAIS